MPRLRAVEGTKEESAREEQRVDPHGQDILPRSGSKDSRALSRETFSEVTQDGCTDGYRSLTRWGGLTLCL